MGNTYVKLQTQLMREYYKDFSKYARGKAPANKVAWVTAFAPVEILEALDIAYYYPESYAAVIAASQKEQAFLEVSGCKDLSLDCCSYSCCMEGCLELSEGPRGIPPKPDILIATNNQCNTLPAWWNILSERFGIPFVIIDYPGERADRKAAFEYVTGQHMSLIEQLEKLSGNKLEFERLESLIRISRQSVEAWERVRVCLVSYDVTLTTLFDDISFLITARCKPQTSELYGMLEEKIKERKSFNDGRIPLFWLGYPLWYHEKRYLEEYLSDFHIVGSNYITWWSLDYSGSTVYEQLFQAYNFTFLNLSQNSRNRYLEECINQSGAICAVAVHNKSCKCDFVSTKGITIPYVELELDMIDRAFMDKDRILRLIEMLKETVCTE